MLKMAKAGLMILRAAALLLLLSAATTTAQICDDLPPVATYADSLLPPEVDWNMRAYYPPEGTHLDQIGSSYYQLENEFKYFGLAADFDPVENEPPHYYLPLGWREYDLVTFTWNRPEDSQIIHEPILKNGLLFAPDGVEDSVLITPKLRIRGSYDGNRDQRIMIGHKRADFFMGDAVSSVIEPGQAAWTPDDSLALRFAEDSLGVGDTLQVDAVLFWNESYAPDEEFAYAPGDSARSGEIAVWTTYTQDPDSSFRMLDTNLYCAHELFDGLYVSMEPGTMDPDLSYELVVEEFDGYHVWRAVDGSSEGWVNIWKLSRNEERDKEYWWWVRGDFPDYNYNSVTPVFGQTDQRVYLDFDVHNGFSYRYAITSFDRGFNPSDGGGGHYILDNVALEDLDTIAQAMEFTQPAGNTIVKEVYAVPNPLRTGKSALENPKYHNYPGEVVHFVGLTAQTTMRVFALDGNLVFEAEHNDPDSNWLSWDTRNRGGELVASGVYIFRASNPDGEENFGKLVIIR